MRLLIATLAAIGFLWAMMEIIKAEDESYLHAQGHNEYRGWSSRRVQNCCNNEDCHALKEGEWRESETGTEVKIAGEWCPVKLEHFLIRGKSPNWETAHACINNRAYNVPPCERLLCFTGEVKG